MDGLVLKPRQAVVDEVENWDDDDLDIGGDDFNFRSASLATSAPSHARESLSSSRMSFRSDIESNFGGEEKQVHIPENDENSILDAIATASRAGIPIPHSVPSSALTGGTIKRLGGRKVKKLLQDDWDDGDLELPGEGALRIKKQDSSKFPETIRQVSGPNSNNSSPMKTFKATSTPEKSPTPALRPRMASNNLLDQFRDDENDDDFFGDGTDTIKVPKLRTGPKLIPFVTPPTPQKSSKTVDLEDDFEQDFQLPGDGEPLRLSVRRDIPKTPVNTQDEFDEWGEGSLGTRFGGTRRDGRSNRSSSVSAFSHSVASSITAESEDEGLDGIIIPSGPLHFDDILKKRLQDRSPDNAPVVFEDQLENEKQEDFLSGLDIGDEDVFQSNKRTLNRNVKVNSTRQTSPKRPKTAVSLVFTNKPSPTLTSRLPRPLGSHGHERLPSLEPVSESGAPFGNRNWRSQSRLGGHSAQSSQSSIASASTFTTNTSNNNPSTPRRRDLGSKMSATTLRHDTRQDATTTNAQLLKLKRSMPTMRTYPQSPAKLSSSRYERPPSRSDNNRPPSANRPKTPSDKDKSRMESSLAQARKNPLPFLPAGSSASQSHHVTIKTSRTFRRHDSESSNNSVDLRPISRAFSRSTMRSPSPQRPRGTQALAREAAMKRQITKPVKRRHFGDGFELDGFDDLPTSRDTEQKFMKEPIGRGPPKQSSLRNLLHQESQSRTTTPAPAVPYSPARSKDDLPRFARDTNASRMAREHSLAQRTPSISGPLSAVPTPQIKPKVSFSSTNAANPPTLRSRRSKLPAQKPQLIKPIGSITNAKSIKGMYYNPQTFRWEGNENDLTPFDTPVSPGTIPSQATREKEGAHAYREKENTTPRPALITNINSSQNVQVVGGMVFDPQRMCWLKIPSQSERSRSDAGDTMDGFDPFDDEEDVFKDVPDLEDSPAKDSEEKGGRKSEGASGLNDDWLVGEEFDVGPEFIRRQREEEERWRRKCEKWISPSRDTEEWQWRIRDVIGE